MAQGEPWSPRKKLQQHSGTKRPEQSFTQTLEECLHFVCITQSQAGPGQSQEGLPTRRGGSKWRVSLASAHCRKVLLCFHPIQTNKAETYRHAHKNKKEEEKHQPQSILCQPRSGDWPYSFMKLTWRILWIPRASDSYFCSHSYHT